MTMRVVCWWVRWCGGGVRVNTNRLDPSFICPSAIRIIALGRQRGRMTRKAPTSNEAVRVERCLDLGGEAWRGWRAISSLLSPTHLP